MVNRIYTVCTDLQQIYAKSSENLARLISTAILKGFDSLKLSTGYRNSIIRQRTQILVIIVIMVIMYRSASRAKYPSHLRLILARWVWFLREIEHQFHMFRFLRTVAAFLAAILLTPVIIIIYCVVYLCRKIRFRIFEWLYPDVDFLPPSLSSVLDTTRNQSIATLLFIVKGTCCPQRIKKKLQDQLLEKRTPDGVLKFPSLRKILGSRLGYYCWIPSTKRFNIDNHVLAVNPTLRGRMVTGDNLQDFVNDFCTKSLPADLPPWQVVLIPLRGAEDKFCVLLRLHHLVSDGLTLRELIKTTFPNPWSEQTKNHNAFMKIVAIPQVGCWIWKSIQTKWDDFMLNYDPKRNPHITESDDSFTFMVLLGMSVLFSIKEIYRFLITADTKLSSTSERITFRYLRILVSCYWVTHNEFEKCNISCWTVARFSWKFLSYLWPLNLADHIMELIWFIVRALPVLVFKLIRFVVKFPFVSYREWKLLQNGENEIYKLIRLALAELWWIARVAFCWPRMLLEEFMKNCENHPLQRMTHSGRKSVAWSETVPLDFILKIRAVTGATVNEILMAACSGALRDYFKLFGTEIADNVHTTIPVYTDQFTEATETMGNGMVTLAYPTGYVDTTDMLKTMKHRVKVMKQYPEKYLLSAWIMQNVTKVLPSLLVRVAFSYLTRKYAVMTNNVAVPGSLLQLFGQPVDEVLFWRPPQANISLSLTVMCYRDHVRLAVMTDHLLAPQHGTFTNGFTRHLYDLAVSSGVQRERHSPHASRLGSPQNSPPCSPSKGPPFMFPAEDSD